MAVLVPFVLIPFCVQFFTFGYVKHRLLRWFPVALMEILLIIGMASHWISPPSFDILGWEIYLWLIGSVFLGGILAWGAYVLYDRKEK